LISRNLTIAGPGASQLAISGNHASRVFEIGSGATVAISGLSIQNGVALTGDERGAGIANRGTLTVTSSTLSGNSAPPGAYGGGIFNEGTLTLATVTLAGNSAGNGGGITNAGPLAIMNSTFSGNSPPTMAVASTTSCYPLDLRLL
jgi:hypothetical protein